MAMAVLQRRARRTPRAPIAAVASADPAELARKKVDDFELLISEESPGKALVDDIRQLAKFYRRAANNKLGIVMYTA